MSSQDLSPGLLMASFFGSVLAVGRWRCGLSPHTVYYMWHPIASRILVLGVSRLLDSRACVSVSVGFLLIDIYSDQNFTLPEARAVSDGSAWCVRVSVHLV